MVVHKQIIHPHRGVQTLELPNGAKALSVAEQYGKLVVWYVFDEKVAETASFNLRIVNTGEFFVQLPTDRFIGTVLLMAGSYVAHVFTEGW